MQTSLIFDIPVNPEIISSGSPINSEKFTRQCRQIYDILLHGETMDVFKAIGMGIYHLHSRLSELRNKNKINIYDRMVKRNGIDCKEYSLTPFIKE